MKKEHHPKFPPLVEPCDWDDLEYLPIQDDDSIIEEYTNAEQHSYRSEPDG